MEIWREISGTNGKYQVSNYGRVRSRRKILLSTVDKKGYERIKLSNFFTIKVHREVAKAFIENPENKPQVNHKDGDKLNNHFENLEWATNLENSHHAIENNLWENVFAASKITNDKRKTPIIAVNIITSETLYFSSMSDAERRLNTRHINEVIKGKRTQANGYKFMYAGGGD